MSGDLQDDNDSPGIPPVCQSCITKWRSGLGGATSAGQLPYDMPSAPLLVVSVFFFCSFYALSKELARLCFLEQLDRSPAFPPV